METLIAVGETKYVPFSKVYPIKDKVWEYKDLEEYCAKHNIQLFTLDDYCDAVNGMPEEECWIDFCNVNVQYCFVNL